MSQLDARCASSRSIRRAWQRPSLGLPQDERVRDGQTVPRKLGRSGSGLVGTACGHVSWLGPRKRRQRRPGNACLKSPSFRQAPDPRTDVFKIERFRICHRNQKNLFARWAANAAPRRSAPTRQPQALCVAPSHSSETTSRLPSHLSRKPKQIVQARRTFPAAPSISSPWRTRRRASS